MVEDQGAGHLCGCTGVVTHHMTLMTSHDHVIMLISHHIFHDCTYLCTCHTHTNLCACAMCSMRTRDFGVRVYRVIAMAGAVKKLIEKAKIELNFRGSGQGHRLDEEKQTPRPSQNPGIILALSVRLATGNEVAGKIASRYFKLRVTSICTV